MFCKYYILILFKENFIYKSFTVSTTIITFTIKVLFTNSVQNIQHVIIILNAMFFQSGFTGSISDRPVCEAETSLDTEDIQSATETAVSHHTEQNTRRAALSDMMVLP